MQEESRLGRILALLPVAVIALIGLAVIVVYSTLASTPPPLPPVSTRSGALGATPAGTPAPRRTLPPGPTSDAPHTATPTVQPGGSAFELNPAPNAEGWVASDTPSVNHLGDYNIHSGIYSTTIYYGVLMFDLSDIPPGTRLQYATLELVGLSGDRLGSAGNWQISMLDTTLDQRLQSVSYEQIRDAAVAAWIGRGLAPEALGPGRTNLFEFSSAQLEQLQQKLLPGRVVFRVEGPARGANNLFTWDTGNQNGGLGYKPILRLGTGPLAIPPTPTYVLVTSTPTALNPATAEAVAATATYVATAFGTATPLPANWVTPIVVTVQGDADVLAAATRSAVITAQAILFGTSTPTPNNWVPAAYVTATPTPENEATRAANAAVATAFAVTTGTATPFPFNVFVITLTPTPSATPTPVMFAETLTPGPTPTSTPGDVPAELKSKILFLSDRSGREGPYVMNPDGTGVYRLTSTWPHQFVADRDNHSLAGGYTLGVANARTKSTTGTKIVLFDAKQMEFTVFENGGINYDPAFAPDSYHVVFVSTVTGRDEIYVTDRDGLSFRQLTNSTWEWNKKPTWSPDGLRIAWWSNRETGHRQIWVMNADGTSQVNISNNLFNDYDPIWVK